MAFNIQDYFNKIKGKLSDKKTYYMLLYLFISLFILVLTTKPSFGFDPFNLKVVNKITNFANANGTSNFLETIGLGYKELYFYLGFVIIYIILVLYIMYNRIDECIVNYRKKNPKYANYTTKDFFINFATDVLYDAFKNTIKTLITPFIIFIIITISYLILNNVSKVAIPLKFFMGIIYVTKVIVIPIINCWLFFIYYIVINLAC